MRRITDSIHIAVLPIELRKKAVRKLSLLMRPYDNTVMTCAVAFALLECQGDYTELDKKTVEAMQLIGRQYPDCGYGGMFWQWMFSENPKPYNSFGNGGSHAGQSGGICCREYEAGKRIGL